MGSGGVDAELLAVGDEVVADLAAELVNGRGGESQLGGDGAASFVPFALLQSNNTCFALLLGRPHVSSFPV